MDRLWSPWRYQYIAKASPSQGCIFCVPPAEQDLLLARGENNFVLLNLYPYTNGHIMVAPYDHVATLEQTPQETAAEMMAMVRHAEGVLRRVYKAPGINIGMNVGECAGAGVAGHIHMHLLPRWPGDANFMTTIGETRVLPEDLAVTMRRLKEAW